MTREEEIKQAATQIAKEWYCGPEDEFHSEVEKLEEMGKWVDEHPISGEQIIAMKNEIKYLKRKLIECDKMYRELQNENPWRDAKKELPPKFIDDKGIIYNESIPVAVRVSGSKYWHMAEYYYDTKEWICEENNTYVIRDGYGTVTHWMPIPKLTKGE